MEPPRIRRARELLKQVWEERRQSWTSPPPQTLEEELKRQDEISKRFQIEQECLRVLEPYNQKRRAKYRERWQKRRAEARKAKHAKLQDNKENHQGNATI